MMFQIKKIIIWPKDISFPPREVNFELGKVNIITGASRTGKSAIIPIIDYCLASKHCVIPIDTIRDYTEWYGVLLQTDEEQILISRRVPDGKNASNDFYIERGKTIPTPPIIESPNSKEIEIKLALNKIVAAPFFSLGSDNDQNYGARLSIRDLMALIFQSQEIVANQNILFYKTHSHEHREKLRNWFPYILGAETIDTLRARHELKDIEFRLKKLRREYEGIQKVSTGWFSNMLGLINVADEYGLLTESVTNETSTEELIQIAKDIVDNSPDIPETSEENIEEFNSELYKMEKLDEQLSESIGHIQQRLNEIKRLKVDFIDYGKGVKKRSERLHLSKWLRDVANESSSCVVCGSDKHSSSNEEIDKICNAFEKYEQISKKTSEVPTAFDREELLLKKDLRNLIEERKTILSRLDVEISKDEKAKKDFHKKKQMFLYLGRLKTTLEIFENLADGGKYKKEIEDLEREQRNLRKISNRSYVESLIVLKSEQIAEKTLSHLRTLDVEEKYRNTKPQFSVEDLSIKVLSDEGDWHFLAEVGSASNWVSFHIALFCGLQEFFLQQDFSVVPSFVIFDQPSQVYFPKLKEDEEVDIGYHNEDVDAVKSIFTTINNSVQNSKGKWQAIILDHADKSIYGSIDGIHEVDEWRGGKKLIPEEWINKS